MKRPERMGWSLALCIALFYSHPIAIADVAIDISPKAVAEKAFESSNTRIHRVFLDDKTQKALEPLLKEVEVPATEGQIPVYVLASPEKAEKIREALAGKTAAEIYMSAKVPQDKPSETPRVTVDARAFQDPRAKQLFEGAKKKFEKDKVATSSEDPDYEGYWDRYPGAWDILKRAPEDTWNAVKEPFVMEWGTSDIIVASVAVGSTVGLMFADAAIMKETQKLRNPGYDEVLHQMTRQEIFHGGFLAFYVGSLLFGDAKLWRTAMMSMEAWAITGLVYQNLSNQLFHRKRPEFTDNQWAFGGPDIDFDDKKMSFFSGHTAVYWAVAPIVSEMYSDHPWVGISAYSIASIAGLVRVGLARHWPSDVLAAMFVGYFTGKAILRINQSRHAVIRNLSIMPLVSEDIAGATIGGQF